MTVENPMPEALEAALGVLRERRPDLVEEFAGLREKSGYEVSDVLNARFPVENSWNLRLVKNMAEDITAWLDEHEQPKT
jgi:hypothetical protein